MEKIIKEKTSYNNEKRIICNQIRTPDKTILISHHVHDFKEHKDRITKKVYSVDGGNEYLKRGYEQDDYEELSIYSDAPFDIIRENFYRGSWYTNGDRMWIKLCDMTDDHLHNCIKYNIKLGYESDNTECFPNQMYRQELLYRGVTNINIKEGI